MTTACKKNEPIKPPADPNPKVNSFSSLSPHANDTLLIYGLHLGTDPSKLKIRLNDSITLSVYQCKDSVVSVILPAASQFNYYGSRPAQLSVQINGSIPYSNTFTISIISPEPKGWFDIYRQSGIFKYFNSPSINISIAFPSDSIGYLHYKDGMLKTTDGGATWKQPASYHYGNALCLSVLDSVHVWSGDIGFINTTSDGGNTWQNYRMPSGLNDLITGQYMATPTTGYVVGAQGRIFRISGSNFDTTSEIKLEYQSKWYLSANIWGSLSVVDMDNLMIVGGASDITVFPSVYRPLIACKTNGVYDEYLLPASVTTAGIVEIQMIYNALGFAVDGNNNLLKYTGNRTWTVLPQKANAAWFTSESNGYAAYNEKIYQTTDGGQSWTSVYTLHSGDVVINFATHNGKVWAMGNNTTSNTNFIVKYNPK